MALSAPFFLYLFLPAFLIVYYIVPRRARTAWILAGSWCFYALWRPDFMLLLVAVTLGAYIAGLFIARTKGSNPRAAKTALAILLVADIIALSYFKYFNFGADSLNALLGLAGASPLATWRVILPLGISFYIFQAMSYAIDVYRGDGQPADSFVELAAYVAMFPQLVSGPIIRFKDLACQLRAPDYGAAGLSYGVRRFIVGLCRKALVADAIAPLANAAFSIASPSAADAWLAVIAYSAQLYFDFSGYSDMAIGLAHMMGLTYKENFDAPYRSSSVTEFWRRWHISLSSWLRDYIYIPLGGNRNGAGRTYLNLILVMAIGGLWHGASWNFALWGCWHGAWLCAERLYARSRFATASRNAAASRNATEPRNAAEPGDPASWQARVTKALGCVKTLLVVAIGWVLFRAPDLTTAGGIAAALVGSGGFRLSAELAWQTGGLELTALAIGIAYALVEPRSAARAFAGSREGSSRSGELTAKAKLASALRISGLVALAVAAIIKLSADSYAPFLYAQF